MRFCRCQSVLAEFLEGIKRTKNGVNYTAMANILIVHSQNTDDLTQYTAITWLREFVTLSGRTMLPHMAGILSAILPCLSYSDEAHRKWVVYLKQYLMGGGWECGGGGGGGGWKRVANVAGELRMVWFEMDAEGVCKK